MRQILNLDRGSAGDGSGTKGSFVIVARAAEERRGIGISGSAYEIRKRRRVWTLLPMEICLGTDEWTDLSRRVKDNASVTEVTRRAEKRMWVINTYDQRDV